MGELLSVKVSIANRSYPLRITREEEEKVTRAAENINKRIKEFEENFAVKDKQDLLAMCALQFANEAMGAKKDDSAEKNQNEIQENITLLNLIIDEYLANESSSV